MTRKPSLSGKILKILGQKKIFSAQELRHKTLFLFESPERKSKPEYALNRTLKNLKEAGFIEVFLSPHDEYIRLTAPGRHRLNELVAMGEAALISSSWDGQWRFVMIDLPEDRKPEREAVRYLLKRAGFACLKNSVWVSPHPFENLFATIKKDMGFSSEMMILVTAVIDPDTEREIAKRFSSAGGL